MLMRRFPPLFLEVVEGSSTTLVRPFIDSDRVPSKGRALSNHRCQRVPSRWKRKSPVSLHPPHPGKE